MTELESQIKSHAKLIELVTYFGQPMQVGTITIALCVKMLSVAPLAKQKYAWWIGTHYWPTLISDRELTSLFDPTSQAQQNRSGYGGYLLGNPVFTDAFFDFKVRPTMLALVPMPDGWYAEFNEVLANEAS